MEPLKRMECKTRAMDRQQVLTILQKMEIVEITNSRTSNSNTKTNGMRNPGNGNTGAAAHTKQL